MALSEQDKGKMLQFIGRLLQNPSFKGEEIPVIENHIVNFINSNINTLGPTLKSPEYFPGLEWKDIYAGLLEVLGENVMRLLLPQVEQMIARNLNFNVVLKLNRRRDMTQDIYSTKMTEFLGKMLANRSVRKNAAEALKLIKTTFFERYVHEIYDRRKYLFIELVKVERLSIEPDEYANFMKIMTLLRLAFFYEIPLGQGVVKSVMGADSDAEKNILISKIKTIYTSAIPYLPDQLYVPIINHIKVWNGADNVEASARLMTIAVHRAKTIKVGQKVDKGAETPDKSWFSIMNKNAHNYSYDKKMIEELHQIAFENRW